MTKNLLTINNMDKYELVMQKKLGETTYWVEKNGQYVDESFSLKEKEAREIFKQIVSGKCEKIRTVLDTKEVWHM